MGPKFRRNRVEYITRFQNFKITIYPLISKVHINEIWSQK